MRIIIYVNNRYSFVNITYHSESLTDICDSFYTRVKRVAYNINISGKCYKILRQMLDVLSNEHGTRILIEAEGQK